jgi:hypothetical protein
MAIDFSQLKDQGPIKSLYIIHHLKKRIFDRIFFDISFPKTFFFLLLVVFQLVFLLKYLFLFKKNSQLLQSHYPHIFSKFLYHMS